MYIYYESIVLQTCLFGPTVFPTCFPVCDMFYTCEMTGCDGKTLSSIWKLFGTMSMPCVVPEMLWSLDELKRVLISEFPILETEEGEGFKILFDLFVEWAEILLNYNNQHPLALLNLGNCGPESFSQGISGRAYSCRIALEGCHRTTEDPIALHTPTHRSSYSTKGIVHQKNLCRQPKTFFFRKIDLKSFFIFFSSSEVKCSGI